MPIGDDPKQAVTPAVLADIIRDARAIHAMHQRHESALAKAS